jgi:hypothetical protein
MEMDWHVLQMPEHSTPAIALKWSPQGKRNTGLPKEACRRTTEKMLTKKKLTWKTAK